MIARSLGMDAIQQGLVATAAMELATNVVKYASRGVMDIMVVKSPRPGITILVEDQGPGITDIEEAMKCNSSTGNTLGLGLPGSRRMMDEFNIESQAGVGTRVKVTKWLDSNPT